MAKAREYHRCSVRCGLVRIEMPVHQDVLYRAFKGDVAARNAIVKKFSKHLRTIGVFSIDESVRASITYDMLHIET